MTKKVAVRCVLRAKNASECVYAPDPPGGPCMQRSPDPLARFPGRRERKGKRGRKKGKRGEGYG